MAIETGACYRHELETHAILYCNNCHKRVGIYHRDKNGEEWYEEMKTEWNNCPYCGEQLYDESKI